MNHSDFSIGCEFICGDRVFRCTDVGTRVVVAICVSDTEVSTSVGDIPATRPLSRPEAEAAGWFDGPPYAVAEIVFDEYDFAACEPVDADKSGEGPGVRLGKKPTL